MIQLKQIGKENIDECLALKVRKNQKDWVRSVSYALSLAYVHGEAAVPFAIYDDDKIIGFVMLRNNRECNNFLLWQFMIDERFQSKGYGKAALKSVIEWIKSTTNCHEIVVSYYKGNEVAGKLYRDFGFKEMNDNVNEYKEIDLILQW
ncbi:GNAT family N-acetyltransferase [Paenibacillus gallinarum]|uniref:GNAT family N-acetyltransferase n=1 Tax=Paenibacillus gallinarum TaxID=2762232 RepID=A0ABR8T0K8_9BACL|nr:GNAT family N-acetyltransferase [Paenibacillus gallinarum]MBD7969222.1 GNAT family N-acetyltransferase [Paenibacillus gallinarum]